MYSRLAARGGFEQESFDELRAGGSAWARYTLGLVALMEGDYARAVMHDEEILALFREMDDLRGMAWTLNNLGAVAQSQGDYARAVAHYAESLALFRKAGNTRDIANCLNNLGEVARCQDDYGRAATQYEESLMLFREVGDTTGIAMCLLNLGYVARVQGAYGWAKGLLVESFPLWQKLGSTFGVAVCLAGLATLAAAEGQLMRASRLFAAAEAQHANYAARLDPTECATYARSQAAVRAQLGDATFAAAWAEGYGLVPAQAIATLEPAPPAGQTIAVTPSTSVSEPRTAYASYLAGLTEREVEVLRLLAGGLTYAEIADKLVISTRTVNHHLTAIYGKLGVASRHAAARYAIDHHLV